jgi:pimeloyl-ACP methyl ester carboxylesterase
MVVVPEMPWTLAHPFDRTYEEAIDQIAAEVEQLKARGAERVVIVGHSFGGAAAVRFGATRGGVAGIVALAAGVDPASPVQMEKRAGSVATARAMIAAGHADQIAAFSDFNGSYAGTVYTTPAHYLSYFDPDGYDVMHRNLARWPVGLPLLWIDGRDESPRRERIVLNRVPPDPLTRYLRVPATHTEVAHDAADLVVAWIKCL